MILKWNSVAKREFPLEWKTETCTRSKWRFDNCSRLQRARSFWTAIQWIPETGEISFPSEHHYGTKLIPVWYVNSSWDEHSAVPKGVRLRKSWLCHFADDIQHSLSHQYQWNKQTNQPTKKKTLKRVSEHPTALNSQASLFSPYENGRSGQLYMPSYVNCNGHWTLNTNWTVQLTVITDTEPWTQTELSNWQ